MQQTSRQPHPGIRLTAVVALLLVSLPALAWRDDLKAAKDLIGIGAYAQALERFDRALADPGLKGRSRDRARADRQSVARRLADEQHNRGRQLESAGELIGALNAYRRAAELEPDNAAFEADFNRLDQRYSAAREASAAVLSRTRSSGNWESGLADISALDPGSSVPDVQLALAQLREEATADYTARSDLALADGLYQAAFDHMVRAERFSDSEEVRARKLARHHLLLADQAWQEGRHSAAWDNIQSGLSFEPGNVRLQAYADKFRSQWLGLLYNEAAQAMSEGRLDDAQAKFTLISRYQPGYLDVAEQLNQLDATLVTRYYDEGDALLARGSEHAGLALAYFMNVAARNPSLYPDIYDRIAEAKQALRSDQEFRVSLTVKNSSGEPGASGVVRENILSSLKGSSLSGVKVLEREALDDILREQGLGQAFFDESTAVEVKKIQGLQAGIYVDVVKFTVSEHGRDRPSYNSARYVSGTRYVPNPNYSMLQQEVANAQQRVLRAQQRENTAKAEQNRMLNTQPTGSNNTTAALASLGAILSSAGASSESNSARRDLENLQRQLAAEPAQIEEEVYSDWRYPVFDLELSGEVILSYKIVNFTTSEIGDARTVNASDLKQDRYVPGDPGKGVNPDPIDLPSQERFKTELLEAAMESLIAGLEQELGAGTRSAYQRASIAAENGDQDLAIENYIRFLYGGADLASREAAEANDYLYETLGIQLIRKSR